MQIDPEIQAAADVYKEMHGNPCGKCGDNVSVSKRLVLTNWQSPGDVLMISACVRDLHLTYPNRFLTDLRTSCEAIWQHNPYITRFPESWIDEEASRARDEGQIRQRDDITIIPMMYQITNRWHFVEDFHRHLGKVLGLDIPLHWFHGDIHIGEDEQSWMSQLAGMGIHNPYWIINTGGKWDFTAKWPNWNTLQDVVWRLMDRIVFVQVGDAGNWQPPLANVIDLLGQTDLRMLIRLIWHSAGVITPLNGIMHLAAAVPYRYGACRPCVVLAGGREHLHWEAYPTHRFLSNVGCLPCCTPNACDRARCTPVGDADDKDRPETMCQTYVELPAPRIAGIRSDNGRLIPISAEELRRGFMRSDANRAKLLVGQEYQLTNVRIAKCQNMLSADDIVRAVESYYEGGVLNAELLA